MRSIVISYKHVGSVLYQNKSRQQVYWLNVGNNADLAQPREQFDCGVAQLGVTEMYIKSVWKCENMSCTIIKR